MKKALSLLLALVLCLGLCACAVQSPENKPKTVEQACAEADKLVAQWNSEAFAGCGYSGEYDTEQAGGPYYIVNARYFKSIVESSDYPEYVLTGITQDIFSDVYPKLCDVFEGLNVCVLITLADENGANSYSGIIDGEITYFEGSKPSPKERLNDEVKAYISENYRITIGGATSEAVNVDIASVVDKAENEWVVLGTYTVKVENEIMSAKFGLVATYNEASDKFIFSQEQFDEFK